ncbi:hypothetical protein CAEBREN_02677 [Caenorhabditis brenneri]|uniref:C-type lectin domain-containing protein n=1 Tax=Caenorhabditis brenneri TaxID=135651 RepID=G0NZS2_CAEBE|nr:hypothetical protein CAEBREN_02677 [Caenorhabditis brenneri]
MGSIQFFKTTKLAFEGSFPGFCGEENLVRFLLVFYFFGLFCLRLLEDKIMAYFDSNINSVKKVGPSNSDYYGAMTRCTALGAALTGLQSNEERFWIDQEVNRQTMSSTIRDAGTWLGAQKIAGTNQFQWTDGHTTGLVTMGWGPKQPDNSNMRGRGSQDCVHIISLNTGYTRGWTLLGFVTGQLDDINCGYNDDPPQNFYACGKKPS